MGMSLCLSTISVILDRICGRQKDGSEGREMMGPVWKILQKDIYLEEPIRSLSQVYLGCTQREADVDHEAVQEKADALLTNHHGGHERENETRTSGTHPQAQTQLLMGSSGREEGREEGERSGGLLVRFWVVLGRRERTPTV